jgi:hypothetical protein
MTNNELRHKIAEVKGWIVQESLTELWYLDEIDRWQIIPNWPVNIADAWELEEEVPTEKRSEYTQELDKIIHGNFKPYHPSKWDLLHASPRDRCLAYLEWKLTCSANNVTTP